MKQEDKFILRGELKSMIISLEITAERIQIASKKNNHDAAGLEIQYELKEFRSHLKKIIMMLPASRSSMS